jgi:hypothetical protein
MKKLTAFTAFIVALFFFSATGISATADLQTNSDHYVIGTQANYSEGESSRPRMVVYHHGNKTFILGFIVPFGDIYFRNLAAGNRAVGNMSEPYPASSTATPQKVKPAIAYLFGTPKEAFNFDNLDLHGEYYAEGATESNVKGTGKNLETMVVYYHELTISPTIKLRKNTKIFTQIEARDEIWGKNNPTVETAGSDLAKLEENIAFRKAYGRHKFAESADGKAYHEIWAGLMECGVWGTSFKDGAYDGYRARYDLLTKFGLFTGINEKIKEASDGNAAFEEDDDDIYVLAYAAALGLDTPDTFGLMQAFAVNRKLQNQYGDAYNFALSIKGKYKTWEYEGETDLLRMKWNNSKIPVYTEDTTTYGAYMNVAKNMGPLKLGILGAYGSFNKTDDYRSGNPLTPDNEPNSQGGIAHHFGYDFDAGGALLLGDTITFYRTDNTGYDPDSNSDVISYLDKTDQKDKADKIRIFNTDVRPQGGGDSLAAGRLVAIYADYKMSEQLNFGAYAGYAKCGVDIPGDKWTGATAWELSGDATYAILPGLQYEIGAGIGQLSWGENSEESDEQPDKAYKVLHKLTFSF